MFLYTFIALFTSKLSCLLYFFFSSFCLRTNRTIAEVIKTRYIQYCNVPELMIYVAHANVFLLRKGVFKAVILHANYNDQDIVAHSL